MQVLDGRKKIVLDNYYIYHKLVNQRYKTFKIWARRHAPYIGMHKTFKVWGRRNDPYIGTYAQKNSGNQWGQTIKVLL